MAREEDGAQSPKDRPCDLCGLAVGAARFTLPSGEEIKYFCCHGCQRIYQLLHGDGALADGNTTERNRP